MASSLNTTPSGSKGATPSSSSLNRLSTASIEGKTEGSKLRSANPSQYVKLNVGGSLHYTTIGTLTKHDNMLRAMFSGRMEVLTDAEGWILIDRCGKHFGTILNFLRDGDVPLPDSRRETLELQAEAKYYCIEELNEICEKAVKNMKKDNLSDVEPICRVPLITSVKEEQVCCTAIVYATDRKNTKVEFPEARIYEETLNCLLYENRNGPDQELMQATSLRVPVASYTSDDEDDRQRCQHPGSGASVGATGSHSGNSGNANSSHSEKGLARLRSNKNH